MVIGCELGDVSRVVESPMKGEAPEKMGTVCSYNVS